jgi:hypothetical protein
MSQLTQFHLRWKGSVTGPFPLPRINEMLRSGEISLVHSIEIEGGWMTLRDYLRSTSPNRANLTADTLTSGDAPLASAPINDYASGHESSPDTFRNAAGESLERIVREGYLWCGSTFIFPLIFAIPALVFKSFAPHTGTNAIVLILTFTTTVGCLLPIYFVRKVGRLLDQEGLGEIRLAQFNLVALLACFGLILWGLGCLWYLNN